MRIPPAFPLVLALLPGCTTDDAPPPAVRFQDVHGLAVDPNDARVLYVATHHGLYRGEDGSNWSKVGTETMDLMGFTMHPTDPNVVYASGHPARPNRDYNALGVVKSTDGGRTWTTVALRNQVDFHAMTISLADPSRVWGYYYRDNHFYESRNAGANWTHYAPGTPAPQINSLASGADNATTAYAGTNDGIWVSTDLGENWRKLPGVQPSGPAGAVTTTKADPDLMWAFFPSSGIVRTNDGGASWTATSPIDWGAQDGPSVIAVDPTAPQTVYVASARGAIHRTLDEGATWTRIQDAAT